MPAQPKRYEPNVTAAPRPRQIYWCDLPEDAHLPEFWKRRPVVILSANARLYGHVTVIPLSTKAQPDNKNAHSFKSILPGELISWAICDHILTIAVSRLTAPMRRIPRVDHDDFQTILQLVHKNIPTPRA
ncbi:MAG: type II toxin-antitoxin system PemK/MazF family toxin [Yoonia sp.]